MIKRNPNSIRMENTILRESKIVRSLVYQTQLCQSLQILIKATDNIPEIHIKYDGKT